MYNLKFTLSPADVYLDNYNGQKAARINGKVWMLYNLGDNRTDPNTGPFDQSIINLDVIRLLQQDLRRLQEYQGGIPL